MFALHGGSMGHDAFAFDPISNSYLEVSDDLHIRTPYSKAVLEELRAIPWQVGTTTCEPGGCRSVRLRSFGADGRTLRRLPDMPTPKKGSDAERPRGTLKLTRRRKCGMRNVGVRRCSRLARCSSAFAKRATTSSTLVAPLRRRYHFARRNHTLKVSPTSPVRGVGMTTGRLQTRPDRQNAGTNI